MLQSIVTAAEVPDISEPDFVALDGRLHRQVAEASGYPLLLHMWDSISTQFEQYSLRVIGMPGRLERAHADHCGIVDAILDRDHESAARHAHDHVAAVQLELQKASRTRR
ncbi:FadR/GntR family transcriptional regulator [Streptomyces sp. NPDC102360]|uniref:FadR/GntR family transcriptional regulator n=1 Tax=Streptomyces sp. NPDC102360 TaxID=3366160 RepID=UPI003803B663